jgi:hypothetical protein
MSQTTWTFKNGNGDFNTAGNWSNGVPVGADQAFLIGAFNTPLTVTVGSADTIQPFGFLSLFDATLAVAGGTITVGTIETGDDTLSAPLSELTVGNNGTHAGMLVIQDASSIGNAANAQVIGLTQTGGTVVFQNGSSEAGLSVLAGGQGGVHQSGGTIEVDYGVLEIVGNSSFAGTFASAGGTADPGTSGTIDLAGGAIYNFNSGLTLDTQQVELQGVGSVLQINANLTDQYVFVAGAGTTIQLSGNTLTLKVAATLPAGSYDQLGGAIDTSGTVVNMGTVDDSGLVLENSVLFENAGAVNQNGAIVIGNTVDSATTLDNVKGATYTLDTNGATVIAGTGMFANAGLFTTSATTPAGAFSGIAAQFNNTGTVLVTAGTLDFANNDTFAGTIGGAGMIELSGGGASTLSYGVALSAGSFYVSGANGNGQLQLAILGSLTYAGTFLQDPGTTIQLEPVTSGTTTVAPTLTLTNTSDVSGAIGGTIIGGNTARLVLAANSGTPLSDNGMIIRGAMTVEDTGQVSQEGNVVIGLLSGDFQSSLVIGQGNTAAIYDFVAPSVLTGNGTITNKATFEQGQQITGTSIVSAYFTSSAVVLCKSGTLAFTGSDTFAGTITGNGMVELSGALFTLNPGLVLTVSTLEVANAPTPTQVDLLGNLTYNQSFIQTIATTLDLAGTLTNGTLSNQPTLTLNGVSQLNGVISGLAPIGLKPSEVVVSATGSASDGNMVLTGAVTLLDQGQIGQQGVVTVGLVAGDYHTSLLIANGASYNLTIVSDIFGDGSITNSGTFAQLNSVTGTSIIGTELTSVDTVTTVGTTTTTIEPSILSNGGILEFTGSDTFGGSVGGAGTIALSGASFTFVPGVSLTVTALEEISAPIPTQVTIQGTLLDYAGQLLQTSFTTLSLDGATTLELTGASDQVGGTLDGLGGAAAALVQWNGVDGSDTGLTMTGNVTLVDNGSIGQSLFVTIGAAAGDTADLLKITAGNTYDLSEQSTIVGVGQITNLGTFEQGVSVTGTSLVAIDFTSNASTSTVLVTDGTLLFNGGDTFGGTITGAGEVALEGANFTFDASIVVTVASLHLVGGVPITDLKILGNTTYGGNLTTDIGTTISLAPGVTLDLTGASNTLEGVITTVGGGLLYQSAGSESGLALEGSSTLFDTGFIGQAGAVTIGVNAQDTAALVIEKGASYNFRAQSLLTGNGSVINNGVFGQGQGPTITNQVSVASFVSTGTVVCGSGSIQFSGTDTFGGTATTAGTISGGGAILLNGGTFTFAGAVGAAKNGLAVTVGTLDLYNSVASTQLNVAGTVSYGGAFTEVGGVTVSLESGANLTLSGGPDLINGNVTGGATTQLSLASGQSTTDDGMVVTGAMTVADSGSVSQSGTVTLGLTAGDKAVTLRIAKGATYDMSNSAVISGFGTIDNLGTVLKDGLPGFSTITPAVVNFASANVTASSGALDFIGSVQNNGTITAINGGTVEFGGAVSAAKGATGTIDVGSTGFAIFQNGAVAAETVAFTDAQGHIVLNQPGVFNATIAGFQAVVKNGVVTQSDSIDLVGVNHAGLTATYAPTTTANASGILTVTETVNGQATTVAQLHFAGSYSAGSFLFAADNAGTGTIITDPPTHAKITAANVGTASAAFTNSGGGIETAVLAPAGNGIEAVSGFRLNGIDVLDLRQVLAGAAGHPNLTDIGNYISASVAAGNTTLFYDPAGGGHGGAFAVLDGVSTTMNALLAHHALSLG